MLKDEPVEILRTESGIVARSMLCTHFGCGVAWNAELGLYACACHEGRFSPEGRPLAGPPTLPLRTLPARIEGDQVLVEPPP
jgi:Rieske Fe-S protein